jgi:hypothetical protein
MSTTHSSCAESAKEVPEERKLVFAQAADVSRTAQRPNVVQGHEEGGPGVERVGRGTVDGLKRSHSQGLVGSTEREVMVARKVVPGNPQFAPAPR